MLYSQRHKQFSTILTKFLEKRCYYAQIILDQCLLLSCRAAQAAFHAYRLRSRSSTLRRLLRACFKAAFDETLIWFTKYHFLFFFLNKLVNMIEHIKIRLHGEDFWI